MTGSAPSLIRQKDANDANFEGLKCTDFTFIFLTNFLLVTRRDRMVATLRVASQIVERGLVLGQTGPPVEQEQRGVEAGPEVEHAHKKRRVAQLDVVELSVRDIENWQPGRRSQEAAQPRGTSKKKLNSGEETEKRDS